MKTALIIDDVDVSRYTISISLEELGIEYKEANDEISARESLGSMRPDVVFLDWHLKKESGLDLIQEIKNTSGNAPIIVISGVEGLDKESEAKDAGASIFITKPASREDVEKALKNLGIL